MELDIPNEPVFLHQTVPQSAVGTENGILFMNGQSPAGDARFQFDITEFTIKV